MIAPARRSRPPPAWWGRRRGRTGAPAYVRRLLFSANDEPVPPGIGICIGARTLGELPSGTDYSGAETFVAADAVRGYYNEHVTTAFNDIGNASGMVGMQVWASSWHDRASLTTAELVGLRVLGLRTSYSGVGVLDGTRIEAAPLEASISLWGSVDLEVLAPRVVSGGYSQLIGTFSWLSGSGLLTAQGSLPTTTAQRLRPGDLVTIAGIVGQAFVVTAQAGQTVTVAPPPGAAGSAEVRLMGFDAATVRIERDPPSFNPATPRGTVRLRGLGGSWSAQDKKYGVRFQPNLTPVTGTADLTQGSTTVGGLSTGHGLAANDLLEIEGVNGVRKVVTASANSVTVDVPLPATIQDRKLGKQGPANGHFVYLRFDGGFEDPDTAVPGIRVSPDPTSNQVVFFNNGDRQRQAKMGVGRPVEVFNDPDAAGPVFAVRSSGALIWGDGTLLNGDVQLERAMANRLDLADGDSLRIQGTFDGGTLQLGGLRLYRDTDGNLRYNDGAPATDADGKLVASRGVVNILSGNTIDFGSATLANVSTASITSISNGPQGMPLTLVFLTAATLTLSSTFFKLTTTIPTSFGANDTLTLVRSGNVYYEVSRSDNT